MFASRFIRRIAGLMFLATASMGALLSNAQAAQDFKISPTVQNALDEDHRLTSFRWQRAPILAPSENGALSMAVVKLAEELASNDLGYPVQMLKGHKNGQWWVRIADCDSRSLSVNFVDRKRCIVQMDEIGEEGLVKAEDRKLVPYIQKAYVQLMVELNPASRLAQAIAGRTIDVAARTPRNAAQPRAAEAKPAKPKREYSVAELQDWTKRVISAVKTETVDGVTYAVRWGKRYELKVTADATMAVAGNMRLTFGDRSTGENPNRVYWRQKGAPAASTLLAYVPTDASPVQVAETKVEQPTIEQPTTFSLAEQYGLTMAKGFGVQGLGDDTWADLYAARDRQFAIQNRIDAAHGGSADHWLTQQGLAGGIATPASLFNTVGLRGTIDAATPAAATEERPLVMARADIQEDEQPAAVVTVGNEQLEVVKIEEKPRTSIGMDQAQPYIRYTFSNGEKLDMAGKLENGTLTNPWMRDKKLVNIYSVATKGGKERYVPRKLSLDAQKSLIAALSRGDLQAPRLAAM